jgi:hypothetical protein
VRLAFVEEYSSLRHVVSKDAGLFQSQRNVGNAKGCHPKQGDRHPPRCRQKREVQAVSMGKACVSVARALFHEQKTGGILTLMLTWPVSLQLPSRIRA